MKTSTASALVTAIFAAVALIANSNIKEAGAQFVFMLAFGGIVFMFTKPIYNSINTKWIAESFDKLRTPRISLVATKRQFIAISYFISLVVLCAFPPFYRVSQSGNSLSIGHNFVFGDVGIAQIDTGRLLLYVLGLTVICALTLVLTTIQERTIRSNQ